MTPIDNVNQSDKPLSSSVSSSLNPSSTLPWLWQAWIWSSAAAAALSVLSILANQLSQ